jgi:NADH-quinone oxidoreductase subunit I
MALCVFCGLCEEVCPVEAIVMSDKYEIAELDRGKMLLQKEQLMVTEKDVAERIKYIRNIYGTWNY